MKKALPIASCGVCPYLVLVPRWQVFGRLMGGWACRFLGKTDLDKAVTDMKIHPDCKLDDVEEEDGR